MTARSRGSGGFIVEVGRATRSAPHGNFIVEFGGAVSSYYLGSDIAAGSWTPSAGATLFGVLDETTADDADYAVSGSIGSSMECKFAAVLTPIDNTGHIVSYRIKGENGANVTVTLYCGTTLIKSWAHAPAPVGWTQYDQPLTPGTDTDAITDYSNLRIHVTNS